MNNSSLFQFLKSRIITIQPAYRSKLETLYKAFESVGIPYAGKLTCEQLIGRICQEDYPAGQIYAWVTEVDNKTYWYTARFNSCPSKTLISFDAVMQKLDEEIEKNLPGAGNDYIMIHFKNVHERCAWINQLPKKLSQYFSHMLDISIPQLVLVIHGNLVVQDNEIVSPLLFSWHQGKEKFFSAYITGQELKFDGFAPGTIKMKFAAFTDFEAQLKTLVLEMEPELKLPEINGYSGCVVENEHGDVFVKYGCAVINVDFIRKLVNVVGEVEITADQLKEIYEFLIANNYL